MFKPSIRKIVAFLGFSLVKISFFFWSVILSKCEDGIEEKVPKHQTKKQRLINTSPCK